MVRIQWVAKALGIVGEDFADKSFKLSGVRGGGSGPPFVFLEFVEEEARHFVLLGGGQRLEALEGLFHEMGHMAVF